MGFTHQQVIQMLTQAAKLRLAGNSWEKIAKELSIGSTTIRTWAQHRYRDLWQQLLHELRQDITEETVNEAREVLRTHMRDLSQPQYSVQAARELLRTHQEKLSQATPVNLEELLAQLIKDYADELQQAINALPTVQVVATNAEAITAGDRAGPT
ncbi:MAG: hypothetical protein R3B84_22225 [Zavarzinella sp.]